MRGDAERRESPGEVGHERRAEAAIEGTVPAEKVGLMTGDPCVGHNAENADQEPTGPQTSPLPDLAGPGSPPVDGVVAPEAVDEVVAPDAPAPDQPAGAGGLTEQLFDDF